MTFRPVPKPEPRAKKPRKYLPRSTKPIARSAVKRSSKPITQRNEARIARKAKAYRKVIASDFHKRLRYLACELSGGLCQCYQCQDARRHPEQYDHASRERAYTDIPIWFAQRGGQPWQRFRSKDGELHHLNYKFFGQENDAEIEFVQWVWKDCHKRIEAEHSTRRRFLKGRT